MNMETANNPAIASVTPLSALELNGIKLDERHTILTPQYLESLLKVDKTDVVDGSV